MREGGQTYFQYSQNSLREEVGKGECCWLGTLPCLLNLEQTYYSLHMVRHTLLQTVLLLVFKPCSPLPFLAIASASLACMATTSSSSIRLGDVPVPVLVLVLNVLVLVVTSPPLLFLLF